MPESSVLLLYSVFLSDEPHKSHHDFLAAFFSTLLVKPRCYMIHHSVYIVAVTIEYVSESLHTSTLGSNDHVVINYDFSSSILLSPRFLQPVIFVVPCSFRSDPQEFSNRIKIVAKAYK